MLLLVLLAEKHGFVLLARDRRDETLLRGLSRAGAKKRKNLCVGRLDRAPERHKWGNFGTDLRRFWSKMAKKRPKGVKIGGFPLLVS
jgi:hypothetical protein